VNTALALDTEIKFSITPSPIKLLSPKKEYQKDQCVQTREDIELVD